MSNVFKYPALVVLAAAIALACGFEAYVSLVGLH